jgi:hypothetical protein
MERRAVVSYAGDRALFARLESGLHSGLPTEAVEWKRSYGRSSRTVLVEVDFLPFNAEELMQVVLELRERMVLRSLQINF